MKRSGLLRRKLWTAFASCLLLTASVSSLACVDKDAQARADLARSIDAEIERLTAEASSVDRETLPQSLAGALDSHVESLEGLRGDGSPELRLYELRDPFVGIETVSFFSEHVESVESTDSLEALGGPLEGAFSVKTAATDGSVRSALIETAATRARRLIFAGVRYGRISSPQSGLYYLAQAAGNRRFHDFLAGLGTTFGTSEPVPDRLRLMAVAAEIESDALEWLERDPTQRELIPVSVRLEEAREMLEAHQSAGAALLLLEARRELSLRSGSVPEEPPDDAPPSGPPGSFRALLAALGARDEGAEDKETAKIARAELLPLYESMLVAPGGPDADPRRSVTLTLVRWPYT